MGTILVFCVVTPIAAGFALLCRRRFGQVAAVGVFAVVLVLYAFGMAGALPLGVYACGALAAAAAVYCVYMAVRRREAFVARIITPGFVLFLVVFALAWWGNLGRWVTHNDDYRHWALVVKNMMHLDALANHPAATTVFPGYHPGTALFQYFWCKLSGAYDESYLFRASCLWMLSLLLPVFESFKWKQWKALLPAALAVLLLPMAFHNDVFDVLQVDTLLGLMVTYLLYTWFATPADDYGKLPALALGCAALVAIKSSGAGLAAIVILIILGDCLFTGRRSGAQSLAARAKTALPYLLGMGLATLVANTAWSAYLAASGTGEAWAGMEGLSAAGLWQLITGGAPEYRYRVLASFNTEFFNRALAPYLLNMTPFLWVLALVALALVLRRVVGGTPLAARWKALFWGLAAGMGLFLVTQLVLYLFTYTQYEAERLASYPRYLGTWLLAVLATLAMLLVHTIATRVPAEGTLSQPKRLALCAAGLLLFINPAQLANLTYNAPASCWKSQNARGPYLIAENAAAGLDATTDKVYAIVQNDTGNDFAAVRYFFTPVQVQGAEYGHSIGSLYKPDDWWTTPMTAAEWERALTEGGFTHVYLHYADAQFAEEFGALFADAAHISSGMLFRVEDAGGGVVLVPA